MRPSLRRLGRGWFHCAHAAGARAAVGDLWHAAGSVDASRWQVEADGGRLFFVRVAEKAASSRSPPRPELEPVEAQ